MTTHTRKALRNIRIGVMGCANIADRSVLPAIIATDRLTLVGVASRSRKKALNFADKFHCSAIVGYDALLDRQDIDLIYMPLPTGLHDYWMEKALKKGKHLLVEKSLAGSYGSAQRMVALADARKLLLMENFMFLHHPQHRFVGDLISRGEIGTVRLLKAFFGFPPLAPDNFRYDKALGGGALLDAGAYTVRVSEVFLGSHLAVKSAHLEGSTPDGVDINGGAFLVNEFGQISQIAFGFDNFYQANYEIWGSRGKITVERAFGVPPFWRPKIVVEKQDERKTVTLPADDHFRRILEAAVGVLDSEDYTKCYAEVLSQARLLQEIRESAYRE